MNRYTYCKTAQEIVDCLLDRIARREKVVNITTENHDDKIMFIINWDEKEKEHGGS